ncbi:MAG TPA: DUF1848 family protein, partial [Candidatus Atribacteria bacterium]|nr:DUF1848 family protein [Candidatus Atribacteria bacterium]
MIISASYKTDIPCFYGNWFMNRLKEGFCIIKDAFTRKAKRVSLKQEDVDGIFFWTKDLSNFIDKFKEIRNMGYNFIVHHTIIKYPKEIELMRVDLESCIENLKLISEEFGNRVPVWRYDPIVFSSITDYDYHLRNFEFLSKKLEGITDEVIISFMQLYKKTERNLNLSSKKYNF